MNPDNILTVPARLDIGPVELFLPEPIEAWTLAELGVVELIASGEGDIE